MEKDTWLSASWSGDDKELPDLLHQAATWLEQQQRNRYFLFSHIHTWRSTDETRYVEIYYADITPTHRSLDEL